MNGRAICAIRGPLQDIVSCLRELKVGDVHPSCFPMDALHKEQGGAIRVGPSIVTAFGIEPPKFGEPRSSEDIRTVGEQLHQVASVIEDEGGR